MQPRPRRKYWYKGKILHTCDILRMCGIPMQTYKMRVRRGWSLLLALTAPVSQDSPRGVNPDLVFEVDPIVEGAFHKRALAVVPPDDARIKVYEYMFRSGRPISKRWQGEEGFRNFVEDMGPRPANTVFSVRDKKRMLSPKNCYWGKD